MFLLIWGDWGVVLGGVYSLRIMFLLYLFFLICVDGGWRRSRYSVFFGWDRGVGG